MRELSVTEVNTVSGGCLWAVGTGAATGAAVGTAFPFIGTAVGATVGAVTSAYQYCTDKK